MQRPRLVPAAVCAALMLAVVCSFAEAQETQERAVTYDLRALAKQSRSAELPLGATIETRRRETQESTLSMRLPDGSTQDQAGAQSEACRYVERVDTRPDESPSTRIVHVAEWTMERNGREDTSLAGVTLEVTGEQWRVIRPAVDLGKLAVEWISTQLQDHGTGSDAGGGGAFGDGIAAALLSEAPVAIGERWDLDGRGLTELFDGQLKGRMTLASLAGTGRLVGVQVDTEGTLERFAIEFKIEAAIASFDQGRESVAADEGSTFEATLSGSVSPRTGERALDATVSMSLTAELPQGVALSVVVATVTHEESTLGGEIPAAEGAESR